MRTRKQDAAVAGGDRSAARRRLRGKTGNQPPFEFIAVQRFDEFDREAIGQ